MDDARPEDVVPAAWPRGDGKLKSQVAWCMEKIQLMLKEHALLQEMCVEPRQHTQTGGCCGAKVREYDPSYLAMLRTRLMHGFSLSIDEQRRLFYLAGGERIESRKRCSACDATGELDPGDPCPMCEGTGYIEL